MKKLIALLALAVLATASIAAETPAPVVVISDTSNCYVDGVNVGQPIDAIANNPKLASAIQTAFVAYIQRVQADAAALVAKAKADADKQIADAAAKAEVAKTPDTAAPVPVSPSK